MSILYVITLIILITLVILVEKSKEKIEIIKTLAITGVLILAYNCFACYMLNLANIPITLLNLSIVNLVVSLIILCKIIKDKTIQRYKVKKRNITIVMLMLLVLVTLIVTYQNFGKLTRIRYVSMDAREHYKAAREFSENEFLSNKAVENNTTSKELMPMGYTNAGIIFKILRPYEGTINLYKAYILFEAFVFFLTGFMFYAILEEKLETIENKSLALIFGIIYMIGYPLNAWILGFHYLLIGILFVEIIIYLQINKQNVKILTNVIMLFLANFGLIFSYSLFCPFVYLAEFVYFIYKFTKNKDKAKLILYTTIALILPGIIGVTYLIVPTIGKVGGYIALDGALYKNFWSNFILFIPFSLYEIYANIKNKKFTFENLIFVLLIAYMVVLGIGMKTGKCSEYYFSKNYFILWLMLNILNIKGMVELGKEKAGKYLTILYTIVYLAIFTISICINKTYITNKASDSLENVMEVFTFNSTMMKAQNAAFVTENEINLYSKMEEILNKDWKKYNKNEILFITNGTQENWIQSLTGYKNILYENYDFAVQNLKQNNYKYIVISENRNRFEEIKKYINYDKLELICSIDDGKIYVRKEE